MREIKFRVWNGSEMVYDIVAGKFGVFYINPGIKGDGLDYHDSASLTPLNTKYSNNIPVMAFTGLKDKNGKEIYEGDIIKVGSGKWDVYWSKSCWEPITDMIFDGCTEKDFKIIGNIFENPELLK